MLVPSRIWECSLGTRWLSLVFPLFVRMSVNHARATNSKTERRRKTKISTNVPQARIIGVPIFILEVKRSRLGLGT